MSRKPYIKIVYPDASQVAMILTEAMVRRASGKRIVETESSERESVGQDLFAGSLCCVTETSVELTLNLAPEAMDFALATLIAKNLTQSERDKAMAASDSLELDALFSPRAVEAAGASTCTDEVGSACRAADGSQTQSGEQDAIDVPLLEAPKDKAEHGDIERIILNCLNDFLPDADYLTKTGIMSDLARRLDLYIKLRLKQHKVGYLSSVDLRMIMRELIDTLGGSAYTPAVVASAIDTTVEKIEAESRSIEMDDFEDTTAYTAGLGMAIQCMMLLKDSKKDKTVHALHQLGKYLEEYIQRDLILEGYQLERAVAEASTLIDEVPLASADVIGLVGEIRKYIAGEKESGLHVTIDDEDGETASWEEIEQEARAIGQHKTDKTDKADKTNEEQDGEIEPDLLHDLDEEDGMTPAGEVIGHDE